MPHTTAVGCPTTLIQADDAINPADILDSLPDPILLLANNGILLHANKTAHSFFGIPSIESRQVSIDSIYRPYNAQSGELLESIVKLFSERPRRPPTQRIIRVIDHSGREQTAIENGSCMLMADGLKQGILLALHLQDHCNQLMMITQKMDSLARLAAGFAHDFNNLLTVITSNLFMARCSFSTKNEAYRMLEEAEKAAFQASSLTTQLLVLCNKGEMIKVEMDIKNTLQNMVGFVIPSDNYSYILDCEEDLRTIIADPGRIDQMLTIVLKNAIESMPEGGTVEIKVENIILDSGSSPSMVRGDYVQILISDQGKGIPSSEVSKVFDPYFTTKKDAKGLGLTIAYSVVNQHGGHISFSSTPKGTVFRIILPATVKSDSTPAPKKTMTGRILLMEDEENVRHPIQKILTYLGYMVDTASNGEEALERFTVAHALSKPFDVILLDLTVKNGMGGEKTAQEMLRLKGETRIVLMSGFTNDPLLVHFKSHGFAGAIAKPFSVEEIYTCLQQIHTG
jgi:two-component system, cell cycle sensor histidine kinase and response regulator CckA